MDSLRHLQQADSLLKQNPLGIGNARLIRELGVARATVYRVLDRLRELGAPVVRAKRPGFHKYEEGKSFEFPGFWLAEGEITALLGLTQWISGPESAALEEIVLPLRKRLDSAVKSLGIDAEKLQSLTALLTMHAQTIKPGILRSCCEGLLQGRRLHLRHGEAGEELERVVSPQKLVRYRDNWYLDAYCHSKDGLRSFSLFRICSAQVLKETAKRIPQAELKAHFADSYGIFSGPAKNEAVLCFTGFAADHVEGETWHPREKKSRQGNTLTLRFPYGDSRELVRDILRWGFEVEVLEPKALRLEVAEMLRAAASRYQS